MKKTLGASREGGTGLREVEPSFAFVWCPASSCGRISARYGPLHRNNGNTDILRDPDRLGIASEPTEPWRGGREGFRDSVPTRMWIRNAA